MDAPHWLLFLSRLDSFERQDDSQESVLAPCPCPGHSDKGFDNNPSLRAWLNDAGVVVIKCRTGCPTEGVLDALRLEWKDLYPGGGEEEKGRILSMSQAVFAEILEYLSLAPRHRKDLLGRGFTEGDIELVGFKTLNLDSVPKLEEFLAKKFSPEEELSLVPGFTEEGRFSRSNTGMLIPLRQPLCCDDTDNDSHVARPYLIKSRKPHRPKYYLWASRHLIAASDAGFHWAAANKPIPLDGVKTLRITEGEIKAELSALRTGVPTVSMPGCNRWGGVLDFVGAQVFSPSVPNTELLVAFDWDDVLSKRPIRRELLKCLDDMAGRGLTVFVEAWDTSPHPALKGKKVKGIDDALLAGRDIKRLTLQEARDAILEIEAEGATDKVTVAVAVPKPKPQAKNTVMPFPIEVFPKEVAAWATQKAAMLGCPVDYVAVPALVVAGRALGTHLSVELLSGWKEYGNLYAVIVAEPSSTKSPAVEAAMRPLLELQKEYKEAYRLEVGEAKKAAGLLTGKKVKEVEVPDPVHVYVGDITVEKLTEVLNSNKEAAARPDAAVLYFRDEISAWVNSINQYRDGGADREFYLSAWSGKEAKVDRCSKALAVYDFFFSVLGSTTPDVVSSLAAKGGKADGFFPRVLYSVPEPGSFFRLPEVPLPFPANRVWDVLVRRLWLWRKPQTLQVPPEPYKLFREHYDRQADGVEAGEAATSDDRSMLGKHRAYVLRLALIVHALRVAMDCSKTGKLAAHNGVKPSLRPIEDMGQMEEEDVEAAVKLVEYFQNHYARVKQMLVKGPEDRKINDFVQWAKEKGGGRVQAKDVYKRVLFECRGKAEAIKLFKSAADRGLGVLVDNETFYPMGGEAK